MPTRGKDFFWFVFNIVCTAKYSPQGHRIEIETVKVVYIMWKLQLEICKKTQKAGSPTMNTFIHKCGCIGQLLPSATLRDFKWERVLIINSTAWVRPQSLREMVQSMRHRYSNHLAVSDSKILKTIIFQNILNDGEFETKSVCHLVHPDQVGYTKKFI